MIRFQGMASAKLRDFLESSTIHGLVHISTAKSKVGRAAWVAIHYGRKSLILAPQEIPDISGYQWGFGCQFVKAYITENPVTNQKIL